MDARQEDDVMALLFAPEHDTNEVWGTGKCDRCGEEIPIHAIDRWLVEW